VESNARVDWDFAPMLATAREDSVLNVHVMASRASYRRGGYGMHADQSGCPGHRGIDRGEL
jgi:hypothetical protein